jgi:hypothetical protein
MTVVCSTCGRTENIYCSNVFHLNPSGRCCPDCGGPGVLHFLACPRVTQIRPPMTVDARADDVRLAEVLRAERDQALECTVRLTAELRDLLEENARLRAALEPTPGNIGALTAWALDRFGPLETWEVQAVLAAIVARAEVRR